LNAIPSGDGGSPPGGGGGGTTGLPCDIAQILETHCLACHGSPPTSGATASLLTWDELAAPSNADPSISRAALALARMMSTTSPMPPANTLPPVDATEYGAWQTWVSAGLPKGSCGGDGGTDPYNTPPICTSMATYVPNGDGSRLMYPGVACIACHAGSFEAPQFSIAGTAYPTAHEPDSCNGSNASAQAQVIITGADGASYTLQVNGAGNFYLESAVALPFRAKVVSGAGERVMAAAQTDGDCNGCHTELGANGAPGRIMLP
jgi:hypothetical protein